jgi:hypothetical protein
VVSGTARDKEVIDVMLQNMWESLEDWLQPGSGSVRPILTPK